MNLSDLPNFYETLCILPSDADMEGSRTYVSTVKYVVKHFMPRKLTTVIAILVLPEDSYLLLQLIVVKTLPSVL